MSFVFSAFYEPTDMHIATKPFNLPKDLVKQIKFISPNIHELNKIATHSGCDSLLDDDEIDIEKAFGEDPQFMKKIQKACKEVSKDIDNIIVTLGSVGVLVTRKNAMGCSRFFDEKFQYINAPDEMHAQHRFYSAKKLTNIVNVSGAGDSFNVGFITAMINGTSENICISIGMEGAKVALNSKSAVPEKYFGRDHPCWLQPATYKTI